MVWMARIWFSIGFYLSHFVRISGRSCVFVLVILVDGCSKVLTVVSWWESGNHINWIYPDEWCETQSLERNQKNQTKMTLYCGAMAWLCVIHEHWRLNIKTENECSWWRGRRERELRWKREKGLEKLFFLRKKIDTQTSSQSRATLIFRTTTHTRCHTVAVFVEFFLSSSRFHSLSLYRRIANATTTQ